MKKLAQTLSVLLLTGIAVPMSASGASLRTGAATPEARIAALEAEVASLRSLLANFSRDGNVLTIRNTNLQLVNDPISSVNPSGSCLTGGTLTLINTNFEVQAGNIDVRNGLGSTFSNNGCGNLIVGYDEPPAAGVTSRAGSHNVIVGPQHDWSTFGGIIGGIANRSFERHTFVVGQNDEVSGFAASVSGGVNHVASGNFSAIGGGLEHQVSAVYGFAAGGSYNNVQTNASSIFGGRSNTVPLGANVWQTILGGSFNQVTGTGLYNTVRGQCGVNLTGPVACQVN